MARFTSGKGTKKETTAEKRERKLANRKAHKKAFGVMLVFVVIIIACFALIAFKATGKSEVQKLSDSPLVTEFAETVKTAFEKEMGKRENKTEV